MRGFPAEMWMLDTISHSSDISSVLSELSSHAKWCVCIFSVCQQSHAWNIVMFYRWINRGTGVASPLSTVTHPVTGKEEAFQWDLTTVNGLRWKALDLYIYQNCLLLEKYLTFSFPAGLHFIAQHTRRGGSNTFPFRQLEIFIILYVFVSIVKSRTKLDLH